MTTTSGVIRIELKRADAAQLINENAVLKGSAFISALSPEALRLGTPLRFGSKSSLFQQGQPGHSVFFIIRGDVRLASRSIERVSVSMG